MEWLLIVQGLLNLAVFAALLVWWKDRKSLTHLFSEQRISTLLAQLEIRHQHAEAELAQQRNRFEDLAKSLAAVGERAKAILCRAIQSQENQIPSMEEIELRATEPPRATPAQNSKPTSSNSRSEISLDLRSVLRDQLA